MEIADLPPDEGMNGFLVLIDERGKCVLIAI